MMRCEWLAHLRSALADVDTVVRDMLRRAAERELGPVHHREMYEEASAKIAALLDAWPDEDRGDPAGSGGAGPAA
jgi:hypothetical protein